MSNMSSNYMVNVSCPHCSKKLVVAVSGFGSELAARMKQCKSCDQEFAVNILAVTTPVEGVILDGQISSLRGRISFLNSQRKTTVAGLLVRHEIASKLHQEALETARSMRVNYESN